MKHIESKKPTFISKCNCREISFFKSDLEAEFEQLNLKVFGTFRIDWEDEEILADYYADENDLLECILKFVFNKDEEDDVHIYWDDGSILDVKLKIKCLKKCLDNICDETDSFWIIDTQKKWIIEYYKSYEVVIKEFGNHSPQSIL